VDVFRLPRDENGAFFGEGCWDRPRGAGVDDKHIGVWVDIQPDSKAHVVKFCAFVWRLLEPKARVDIGEDVGVGHAEGVAHTRESAKGKE